MAEISQITLPSGTTYDIKDTVARQTIAGGIMFRGVTTTELTDGVSTNPITINGESYTAANGDLVIYQSMEFLYSLSDNKWHELGDTTGLGTLAYQDSATGSFTPSGSVSKPNVIVTPTTATISEFDTAGSVTPGTANTPTTVTLPTLTMTVSNEILVMSWANGSVTPGTAGVPTSVTLPTSKNTSVVASVNAELDNAPVFTGTAGTVNVS